MALCANGAKDDTLTEMIHCLSPNAKDLTELNENSIKVMKVLSAFESAKIANAILTVSSITKEFKEKGKEYNAMVDQLKSLSQVNTWCKEKTNGKITEIIDSIMGVELLILNAVYFLGKWQIEFNRYISIEEFTLLSGEKRKCEMMSMTEELYYFGNKNYEMCKLNYKENDLCAYIILPLSENINEFIKTFTQEFFENSVRILRKVTVLLTLPKFELNSYIDLKAVLQCMGIRKAFFKGDFTNMVQNQTLNIGEIVQKCFIKVDEKGTEAAAVTAISAEKSACGGGGKSIFILHVNRPFLFVIANEDMLNNVIFYAKVIDPNTK